MQKILQLDTLYEVHPVRGVSYNRTLGANPSPNQKNKFGHTRIAVYGGSVNLYCSDKIIGKPADISAMILEKENLTGAKVFETIPDYIYLTGEADFVVITGVEIEEIEVIA
jgi:hypothetical protein